MMKSNAPRVIVKAEKAKCKASKAGVLTKELMNQAVSHCCRNSCSKTRIGKSYPSRICNNNKQLIIILE
jgi:hypothetical protein